MIYCRKIFFWIGKGFGKLVSLVRDRFDLIEVKILCIGLVMSFFICAYLAYLFFTNTALYKTLLSAAIVHVMGGRALGIAVCLSSGIAVFYNILYNFILEVVIVFVAYGVIVLIMRNIIQAKLFHTAARQAELAAQNQKTNIKKYGAVGLFFFVMLPFFMTGPVVGSIIGYLLNYKPINNFLIVFSGTLSSIVVYALIGNNLLRRINQYIQIDTLRAWVTVVVGILILVFFIYHLKTIKAYLNGETEPE